jgi:6-pyruvoyltetrahydropterin/6-carboxytetrahydropterin synthase
MYEVVVKSDFSSAHKLRGYKGKCENLHGHNWIVEAAVSSKTLNKSGLLVDFRILKNHLKDILDGIDHKNLNELPYFMKTNPTSENIAKYIYDKLKKDGVAPQRVSVWESDSSCATYFGRRK